MHSRRERALSRCSMMSVRSMLSLNSDELYNGAMRARVPSQAAMHPQRAHAGGMVLRSSKYVLSKKGLPVESDSQMIQQLFFDSMPEKFVQIEEVQQLIFPELLRKFLKKVSAGRNSVEATFHGTRADYVDLIMSQGLKPEVCQVGAYGRGAYVGTHAGIAHQYAGPDKSGRRYMCVVLVVVGSDAVKGKQGQRPRSTAMDSLVNPTQYCFVEEDRCLASHVITYRVNGGSRKRIGGGWDDPFERKLSAAIRRSGQNVQRSGKR